MQTIFRCFEYASLRLVSYREVVAWRRNRNGRSLPLVVLLSGVIALAACSTSIAPKQPQAHQAAVTPAGTTAGGVASRSGTGGKKVVPGPATLLPFPGARPYAGEGVWRPAGRLVGGKAAVYETLLVPPGGTERAGIAWMDTKLLSARLYSGSMSPGGGPYKYTAPVTSAAASSLVAAFNGGFKMADAHGGYYTEGKMIRPLVRGAASLVIYDNGSITVGTWGSDIAMTPSVAAVRQNLFPLVVNGRPSARASTRTWRVWGGTCPCGHGQHGTDHQWRSGLGVTSRARYSYRTARRTVFPVGRFEIPRGSAENGEGTDAARDVGCGGDPASRIPTSRRTRPTLRARVGDEVVVKCVFLFVVQGLETFPDDEREEQIRELRIARERRAVKIRREDATVDGAV